MDWIHSPDPPVTWDIRYAWKLRWLEEEPLSGCFGSHNHQIRKAWVLELIDALRLGPAAVVKLDWYCEENGFDRPTNPLTLDLRGLSLCPKCTPELGSLAEFQFGDCRLDGAEFTYCDLNRANFDVSMKACSFDHCQLRGAYLMDADLAASHFDHCDLRGSVFSQSNLTLVKFVGCRLAGADFSGAVFKDRDAGATIPQGLAIVEPLGGEYRASAVFCACEHEPTLADRIRLARDRGSLRPIFIKPSADFEGTAVHDLDWSRARRIQKYIWEQQYVYELKAWSWRHPLRKLSMFLWWVTSDYGRSVSRWLLCSVVICAVFGLAWTVVDASEAIPAAALWGRPICRSATGVPVTPFTRFYFSIVAFTTLGFGDIVPANGSGQVILSMEVILGYVFLGVLLSIVAKKVIASP